MCCLPIPPNRNKYKTNYTSPMPYLATRYVILLMYCYRIIGWPEGVGPDRATFLAWIIRAQRRVPEAHGFHVDSRTGEADARAAEGKS